ncbi:MAG TPA: restriction endonuclease [Thermoanaerobaculia bacterium]|nr:restriction endonuclease [Thermoanaerobaculia bacterium]
MSASTFPLAPAFFHAILVELARNPKVRRRDIYEPVADSMRLTPEQRTERTPSGADIRFRHRIGWSLTMLRITGYIERPALGFWRLTRQGQELLAANPQRLDEATTRSIERAARQTIRGGTAEDTSPEQAVLAVEQSPEERIDAAMRELADVVARELLERISQAPPSFFEDLVLKLLYALGYGASEDDLKRLGGSGDGGIDGVISLDKLGFEKVYVQAKRWQGAVGRPEVQAFYGALAGRKAKKGVFITTSTFTQEARSFADQVADTVVLIDGARLTTLMIERGVGVRHHRTLRIPRVNEDYFEGE